MNRKTRQAFLQAIRSIPAGRVATYGQVARMAGFPGRSRQAGWVLRHSGGESDGEPLPWFRVINAKGESSFPKGSDGHQRQLELLEAEGIEIHRGKVDLKRYAWDPLDELLWGPPKGVEPAD